MIENINEEFVKDGVAYNVTTIYFMKILIYRRVQSTTNLSIIDQLSLKPKSKTTIKGFTNENRSKENKRGN